LDKLEILEVQNNQLVGELPACLTTSLPRLQKFDASNNQLSGELPQGFFGMPELESLNLSRNSFSGDLDKLMTGVPPGDDGYPVYENLAHLLLNDNEFTGDVPAEFIFLSNLKTLKVQNNDLSGNVNDMCEANSDLIIFADCSTVECTCCAACDGK
jgi:Leucine-rich repeat (LRR) protein